MGNLGDGDHPSCVSCSGPVVIIGRCYDTRFGLPQAFGIGRCRECRLEQTVSSFPPDQLKRLYELYYNFGGERNTRYTQLRERVLASRLYRWWLAWDGDISFHSVRGSGRLLDIGCNEGRGLHRYQQNGFLVVEGLELNTGAAQLARARGFTVYTQQLEEFRPTEPYDVIVLSNVLEHIPDPKQTLVRIRRLLRPGGQVWISCPNNASWLRSLFGNFWINWHVPFHIVHFSPTSLQRVLEDAGFKLKCIRQETPSLWVASSVIARVFARSGKPTRQLHNPLVLAPLMLLTRGLLFPFLWLGNRLGRGDCLVVSAEPA